MHLVGTTIEISIFIKKYQDFLSQPKNLEVDDFIMFFESCINQKLIKGFEYDHDILDEGVKIIFKIPFIIDNKSQNYIIRLCFTHEGFKRSTLYKIEEAKNILIKEKFGNFIYE